MLGSSTTQKEKTETRRDEEEEEDDEDDRPLSLFLAKVQQQQQKRSIRERQRGEQLLMIKKERLQTREENTKKRRRRRRTRVDMATLQHSLSIAEQRHLSLLRRLEMNSCPTSEQTASLLPCKSLSLSFATTLSIRQQHLAMLLDAINTGRMDSGLLNLFHINCTAIIQDPPVEGVSPSVEDVAREEKELKGPEGVMLKW